MEIVHFSKIKIGEVFVIDGERFKKHDDLTYHDAYGLEHYIDPLFDVKIGRWLSEEAEKLAKLTAPQVDTSAKIEKGETEDNG